MEWRIEQANCDGQSFHRGKNAFEIAALERQQLGQCFSTRRFIFCENHLSHGSDAVLFEEHVFGSAQTNSLGAKLARPRRIARLVGVGANVERAVSVRPFHDLGEVAG